MKIMQIYSSQKNNSFEIFVLEEIYILNQLQNTVIGKIYTCTCLTVTNAVGGLVSAASTPSLWLAHLYLWMRLI